DASGRRTLGRRVPTASSLPSGLNATEWASSPALIQALGRNVSASHRMTVPSTSAVAIVLPSRDHAAATTGSGCPTSNSFGLPVPADHAHRTCLPSCTSYRVTITRDPSGATASGTGRPAGGFAPGAAANSMVETCGHSIHDFTKYPVGPPKISRWTTCPSAGWASGANAIAVGL